MPVTITGGNIEAGEVDFTIHYRAEHTGDEKPKDRKHVGWINQLCADNGLTEIAEAIEAANKGKE